MRDKTFRGLLIWGMSVIAIAPLVAWILSVLPT
ncbi:hypothetical protein J2S65_004270 [Rhodococcus fascians]|nr:hypothetical protein [Rhodococcus fascians]